MAIASNSAREPVSNAAPAEWRPSEIPSRPAQAIGHNRQPTNGLRRVLLDRVRSLHRRRDNEVKTMTALTPDSDCEYMTTRQAAQHINLSQQFLAIARHRGEGPPVIRIGRAVRYRRSALDEWMEARERRAS